MLWFSIHQIVFIIPFFVTLSFASDSENEVALLELQSYYNQPLLRGSESSNRKLQSSMNKPSGPIIHTFYSRHSDPHQIDSEVKDHKRILQTWKETWKTLGWTPVILTLDDAKKHPDYEQISKQLDLIPLKGRSGHTGEYNRLCYLRWLAMGSDHVSGGWFSDYDVLPLTTPTPEDNINDHSFHVYHRSNVPALLYGSKKEWNHMISLLMKSGMKHNNDKNIPLWSDMFALQEIIREKQCYINNEDRNFEKNDMGITCALYDQVLEGRYILDGKELEKDDCPRIAEFRVVHFSHDAMRHGVLKEGQGMSSRGQVMRDWWMKYIEICGSSLS